MPLHNALKMDAGSPREIDVLISQGGMTIRGAWMLDRPVK